MKLMEFNRKAGALWKGDSRSVVGMISTGRRALYEVPYNYQTRFGDQVGTNPEELLASAHAAFDRNSFLRRIDQLVRDQNPVAAG